MTVTDTSLVNGLEKRAYARLTTYRKNGQPVQTPVWFALDDGKAYFYTGTRTGKARRIGREPRARFGACTVRGVLVGTEFDGTVRQLDGEQAQVARRLLARKYGLQLSLMQFVQRFGRVPYVYFEITPA